MSRTCPASRRIALHISVTSPLHIGGGNEGPEVTGICRPAPAGDIAPCCDCEMAARLEPQQPGLARGADRDHIGNWRRIPRRRFRPGMPESSDHHIFCARAVAADGRVINGSVGQQRSY